MTKLNELAETIHQTATAHGFWENPRNMGEMISLMHSELSEALEEHRGNKPPAYYKVAITAHTKMSEEARPIFRELQAQHDSGMVDPAFDYTMLVREGIAKPEGAAVEIADCLIRELDTLNHLDVDIEAMIRKQFELTDPMYVWERLDDLAADLTPRLDVAENFGQNLARIHKDLALAFGCWEDNHMGSLDAFLIRALCRCLVLMAELGVDIEATVAEKMTYNDSRPYKHNKEY